MITIDNFSSYPISNILEGYLMTNFIMSCQQCQLSNVFLMEGSEAESISHGRGGREYYHGSRPAASLGERLILSFDNATTQAIHIFHSRTRQQIKMFIP